MSLIASKAQTICYIFMGTEFSIRISGHPIYVMFLKFLSNLFVLSYLNCHEFDMKNVAGRLVSFFLTFCTICWVSTDLFECFHLHRFYIFIGFSAER